MSITISKDPSGATSNTTISCSKVPHTYSTAGGSMELVGVLHFWSPCGWPGPNEGPRFRYSRDSRAPLDNLMAIRVSVGSRDSKANTRGCRHRCIDCHSLQSRL